MKPAPYLAIYLRTKNDTNGNPRRGWLIFGARHHAADLVKLDAMHEGYKGDSFYLTKYPDAVLLTTIEVTPGEFGRQMQGASE